MREGHHRAIHPEALSPEPEPVCRPPLSAYLSNNKNQDKSHPPDLLILLDFCHCLLYPEWLWQTLNCAKGLTKLITCCPLWRRTTLKGPQARRGSDERSRRNGQRVSKALTERPRTPRYQLCPLSLLLCPFHSYCSYLCASWSFIGSCLPAAWWHGAPRRGIWGF
jgi:hypothetical protein